MTALEVIEIKEDALSSDYYIDEALNTLRTNIQLSGRHVKSIMVTSTFSDEGKSHISLYLARKLAQIGKKVVYVECDLRKPTQFMIKGAVGEIPGMTHFLSGQIDMSQVIHQTTDENLFVITSGSIAINPS